MNCSRRISGAGIRWACRFWALRKQCRNFRETRCSNAFRSWYAPNNIVITAAGNLEHARLVDLVSREFGGAARAGASAAPTAPRTNAGVEQRHKKELEQVHIVLGVPSYPLAHERRYAASLLNIILGGGMSSRLFQNIRERQGLAYAIDSDLSPIPIRACFRCTPELRANPPRS